MENMTQRSATVANLLTNFTPRYTMQPFYIKNCYPIHFSYFHSGSCRKNVEKFIVNIATVSRPQDKHSHKSQSAIMRK